MDDKKFHEVRLKMMIHDFQCPAPDKMYYIELAEQVRFKKDNLKNYG